MIVCVWKSPDSRSSRDKATAIGLSKKTASRSAWIIHRYKRVNAHLRGRPIGAALGSVEARSNSSAST